MNWTIFNIFFYIILMIADIYIISLCIKTIKSIKKNKIQDDDKHE